MISEGKNFEHIKRAIDLIEPSLIDDIDFSYSDKTGKEQLKHAYDAMLQANLGVKCLFVWDCDHKSSCDSLSETDCFFRFVFAKNEENTKVLAGIENLYPQELFTEDLYTSEEKPKNDGGKAVVFELDKDKFIEQIKQDQVTTHFTNFQPLIDKIKSIIGDSDATKKNE